MPRLRLAAQLCSQPCWASRADGRSSTEPRALDAGLSRRHHASARCFVAAREGAASRAPNQGFTQAAASPVCLPTCRPLAGLACLLQVAASTGRAPGASRLWTLIRQTWPAFVSTAVWSRRAAAGAELMPRRLGHAGMDRAGASSLARACQHGRGAALCAGQMPCCTAGALFTGQVTCLCVWCSQHGIGRCRRRAARAGARR